MSNKELSKITRLLCWSGIKMPVIHWWTIWQHRRRTSGLQWRLKVLQRWPHHSYWCIFSRNHQGDQSEVSQSNVSFHEFPTVSWYFPCSYGLIKLNSWLRQLNRPRVQNNFRHLSWPECFQDPGCSTIILDFTVASSEVGKGMFFHCIKTMKFL